MSLSSVLESRRKELNLTLLEVANRVGVSESTVQRWESGNIKNLRHDRIVRLADVLEVSPSYLMGWGEESEVIPGLLPLPAGEAAPDPKEARLTDLYRQLNTDGQEKLIDYADDLVSSGKYIKSDPSKLGQKQA